MKLHGSWTCRLFKHKGGAETALRKVEMNYMTIPHDYSEEAYAKLKCKSARSRAVIV